MAIGLMSAVTIMSEAARFTMKMSPTIWSFFFDVRLVPITRMFPRVPAKANIPRRKTYGKAMTGWVVSSAGITSDSLTTNGKSMARQWGSVVWQTEHSNR